MASYLKKFMTSRSSKLKEDIQLHFLKRLHRLVVNGYSLLEALEVMRWDSTMKQAAEEISAVLKSGEPIDVAFERANFHHTIIAYIYFVRINGNLMMSLAKCIEMFEHRMTYIKKFTNVIRYPIILFTLFIFLLLFLKQSVLPSFLELFQSSTESSVAITFSILLINTISSVLIIFTLLIVVTIMFWHFYKKNVSIVSQVSFYQKIPIYRTYVKMQTSYYFATHVSMFLKAGMPMKDVLENIKRQNKLPILSYYAQLMIEQLKSGIYIDELLKSLPFIHTQLAKIFQNTHNVDTLERDLTVFADFLAEKLEHNIMKFITYIQPTFFILLASFIIFIYMTLMWPMFQLIKTV